MTDPARLASAAVALPQAARSMLAQAYASEHWRRVSLSIDSCVRAGFWTTSRAARENLEALHKRGLVLLIGPGRFGLNQDPEVREAILDALEVPVPGSTASFEGRRHVLEVVEELSKGKPYVTWEEVCQAAHRRFAVGEEVVLAHLRSLTGDGTLYRAGGPGTFTAAVTSRAGKKEAD